MLAFCRIQTEYKMMRVRRLGEQTRPVGITYDKRTAIEGESVARAAANMIGDAIIVRSLPDSVVEGVVRKRGVGW